MQKCPMLVTRYKSKSQVSTTGTAITISSVPAEVEVAVFQDCIGEECGWWDGEYECCSILGLR